MDKKDRCKEEGGGNVKGDRLFFKGAEKRIAKSHNEKNEKKEEP